MYNYKTKKNKEKKSDLLNGICFYKATFFCLYNSVHISTGTLVCSTRFVYVGLAVVGSCTSLVITAPIHLNWSFTLIYFWPGFPVVVMLSKRIWWNQSLAFWANCFPLIGPCHKKSTWPMAPKGIGCHPTVTVFWNDHLNLMNFL